MKNEDRLTGADEPQGSAVKSSVCALIDLLGFSSHLEISGYDLRTAIGEQAIKRLDNLEKAMALVRREGEDLPHLVPNGFRAQRINDAIICTMDLDDFLLPSVGQTRFSGPTPNDLSQYFDLNDYDEGAEFLPVYRARLQGAVEPIQQFLGIIARIHLFIHRMESAGLFPGARTVISTGFRRPFRPHQGQDDALSANFAFANATEADKSLHGPRFFVDNNLMEVCSRDRLARNLMRFSCFEWSDAAYDCLGTDEPPEGAVPRVVQRLPDPEELVLFQRPYLFRRLNPSPLSFLQHLFFLRPCIEGDQEPDRSNPYFWHILGAVDRGISNERIKANNPPNSFLYSGTNDLKASLVEFNELLMTGESPTRIRRGRIEYLEKQGHPELIDDEKWVAEMDELDAQTVKIEVEALSLEDLGETVWTLSEETLSGLLPLIAGDLSELDFPDD